MKATLKVILTPVLACLAQSVIAQSTHFEDVPVPAEFPQPEGKMIGFVRLDADVTGGLMTTNNVYRDSSHLGSEAAQFDLSTSLASRGARHLIVATLEHYEQEFQDKAFEDMNLDATSLNLFGRFVTSEHTNLRIMLVDEEDIMGKSQSEQLNSFTSGLMKIQRIESIFEIDNSRFFASVMGRNDQIESVTSSGLQNNTLNRSERDYIVLGGRHFGWGKAFFFGGTQAVRYESSSTPALAARNSDENRHGVGAEYEIGKFSGAADIFQFTQRFKSPSIPDIENDWVGSGLLNYAVTDNFTLVFAADRRFHETNIPNSGGIFEENIFIGGTWSFSPNLYLRMGPNYNKTELQNTPVVIDRFELDAELAWQFSAHFEMLLTSNVFRQDAENPAFSDFDAQQANTVLSLKYSL